jgi:F420-dependent oxidoreductase-like protein
MHRIKFGVQALQGMPDYSSLKRVVLECERLEFDSVWVYDHLQFTYGPTLECWTVLSALAEATKRIRIGTLVTCNAYRYPSILAKMVATVDMISNGRLNFGIGAGWLEEEAIAYGIPFPRGGERVQMVDEALTIIKQLWTKDRAQFRSSHYSVDNAICLPKPTQKPYPPILVGGGGPKMLRVIAKHADAWDVGFSTPDEIKTYHAKLEEACREVNRDPSTIENTYQGRVVIANKDEDALTRAEKWREERHGKMEDPDWKTAIVGSPKKCVEALRLLVDAGVTSFNLLFADVLKLEPLRIFAEKVISEFQ